MFLAGSTQHPEEEIAIRVFQQVLYHRSNTRLILVPRHPERFDEVAKLLDQSGLAWQRRSQLKEGPPPGSPLVDAPPSKLAASQPAARQPAARQARVLLVDVVGELGAWWGLAGAGFVGGSLGRRGGQNMIEPAGYGVAVSFGPNTWHFRDIVALLLHRQAAVVVHDEEELSAFVRQCTDSPDFLHDLGARAQQLVLEQQGATRRTVARLLPLIAPPRRDDSDPVHPAA